MTRPESVCGLLLDAETDMADVERWGHVLISMGASHNQISPAAAFVVGEALERLGKRIEAKWNIAVDAARQVESSR
ncbi:hypothetical protein FV226_21785 [Methylobacterium sp. WL12]|uniref:hypothetical protein n=1 Tax=Methylobacterium sp. WL12 TaxID=2603890 RepID=UPI0011C79F3D|nr:hypothetical protein [Methylobacterium sp. WL12]TXM67466.1 hypothetical protein FV226_21785 [Methylobacterium sp. WL12]